MHAQRADTGPRQLWRRQQTAIVVDAERGAERGHSRRSIDHQVGIPVHCGLGQQQAGRSTTAGFA